MIDNNKINSMTTNELAKYFIEQLEEKERKERLVKELNKDIAILNSILYDKMETDSQEETKIDGMKLTLVEDESFALENQYDKKTNPDGERWDDPNGSFFQWLKVIGEEGLIVLKKSVNAKTRESWFKERRANKKDIPDFVKVNFWKHVKHIKAEIKRRIDSEL